MFRALTVLRVGSPRWNLAETGEAFRDVPDYVAVETLMRMMFLQQELSKHADVDADGVYA